MGVLAVRGLAATVSVAVPSDPNVGHVVTPRPSTAWIAAGLGDREPALPADETLWRHLLVPVQQSTDPGGSPSSGGSSRGGGGGGGGGEERQSGSTAQRASGPPLATANTPANNQTTLLIQRRLLQADDSCGFLPRSYRIDCVAVEFRDLAERLPRRGDYAAVQSALDRAARELETIARQSRDRNARRIATRVQRVGDPQPVQTRPLRAVRPDALAAAQSKASQAIRRAEVTLLRSVSDGDPRQVHFQRIAAAFNDTAVLLRS